MKRALLIYNPAAGRWRNASAAVNRIVHRLRRAGITPIVESTRSPGHATELARQGDREQFDAVFSYGGDGTLRECAAGLLGSDTPLGFLPGGTANVMRRALGLPAHPLRAADALARGRSVALDVGLCGDRPFLMQVSVGLDARVLDRLDPRRKRLLGRAEVALQVVPAWWSFRYPRFSVRWNEESRDVSFAAACNIAFYGGHWKMAPAARADDRALDLVLFSGRGRWPTLGLAAGLFTGRHLHRQDVETQRVEEVAFGTAEGLALQLDGDTVAEALPATIRLSSQRVRFLTPATANP